VRSKDGSLRSEAKKDSGEKERLTFPLEENKKEGRNEIGELE